MKPRVHYQECVTSIVHVVVWTVSDVVVDCFCDINMFLCKLHVLCGARYSPYGTIVYVRTANKLVLLQQTAIANESTKVHNARHVHKVVTESDVANVEIISWNCIIILHFNL